MPFGASHQPCDRKLPTNLLYVDLVTPSFYARENHDFRRPETHVSELSERPSEQALGREIDQLSARVSLVCLELSDLLKRIATRVSPHRGSDPNGRDRAADCSLEKPK